MSPARRWLLLWLFLWLALAAFVAVRATWRPDHRGVLLDHLEFGRRLLHGENVYADWRSDPDAPLRPLHAPYPPSFGLLTAPFALVADAVSLRAARLCWALLQILALAAIARALRELLGTGADPPTARAHRWLLLGALLLLSRFVLRDTHGGGGNLINVALCALAFAAAERGHAVRAGWWLGFSLATKPTQIWLLPVLLLLGHRRAALHTVAAGLLCTLLSLLLLRCDPAPWLRWLDGSLQLAAQPDAFAVPALGFPEFEWMNQSLRCACARWLGTVPSEFAARVNLGVWPGLGLAPAAAAWTARSLIAVSLCAVLFAAHRCRGAAAPSRALVFAAALTFSLLPSPLTWGAHHVALLPLVYLLLESLLLEHAVRARSRATCLLLLSFALCCGFGQEIVGPDGEEWRNSLYVLPMFDLALLAAALCLALRTRDASRTHEVAAPAPAR